MYYEAPDAVVLIDPLLPAGEEEEFLAYLDRDVERLGLPVVDPPHRGVASSAARTILRERYDGRIDRVPESVEVYPDRRCAGGAAGVLHPAPPRRSSWRRSS